MEPKEYEIMYLAEESHWWYQGMAAITKKVLETYLPVNANLRILDAGCGTGAGIRFFSQYGTVVGLDISPYAMQFCLKRGLKDVARGSVTGLPFPDESFDFMSSFDIICCEGIDDMLALQEASRVLRVGGKIMIRVPAFDLLRGIHDVKVCIKHRYSHSELAWKLLISGFEVDFINYANTILFPLVVLKRLTEKWLPAQHDSDIALEMGALSNLFRCCLLLESRVIMKRLFPFGLSLVAVGTKKGAGGYVAGL
jgi:SAM-dependent methyltransferase